MGLRTGLDRLLEATEELRGRRYGVLGHAAAVTADKVPIHLALTRSDAEPPARLFGPEHGFYGVEQDMVASPDAEDPWTGAPVVSLYGDTRESLRPDRGAFEALDLLIVDLQDVGSRYYTYAATGVWAAEAALEAGCEVWILDRPNPLGGEAVEGNTRRPGFESFIGAFEMPVRHGLTLAELTLMSLGREAEDRGLRVWPMEGWRRDVAWEATGRAWVAPSPNIPTYRTAVVYPGGCLLEATEFSEGRGTTRPFELIGAPGLDAVALADRLNRAGMPGARFSPALFKPQYQKHAGRSCAGIRWFVEDTEALSAYRCGVEILLGLREIAPDRFSWRQAPYEFESDRPAIDLLSGDDRLRQAIDDGGEIEDWLAGWETDERAFREARRPYLLYPEVSSGGGE
ncbi:MAG: exo-beta-N-acetylmuramidase NamZ domain-containing protein [Thermoanaerobaculia bacterium]